MATLVLEQGIDGLMRGPGTPERLVIDADPKLDDMLAAAFAQRRLQGGSLPTGCEAFARYTAELVERLTMGSRSEGFAELFVVLLREQQGGTGFSRC